jgi:O-antigen polymerase
MSISNQNSYRFIMNSNIRQSIGNKALQVLLGIFITLTVSNIFFTGLSIPNGIIEGKMLYFNFIAALFIVLYLVKAVFRRQSAIRLTTVDIALSAFVLFVIVNYYLKFSFQNDYLLSLILATAVFFIVKHHAAGNAWLLPVFKMVFLLSGLAQGVYAVLQIAGVLQSFHTGFPVTGTFHNPAALGIYMAIIFCFSAAELLFITPPFSKTDNIVRGISILNILIAILVLPSTDSRASWLAVAAGLGFLLLVKYRILVHLSRTMRIVLCLLTFGILMAGSWFLYNYKMSSALGRLAIWRTGIEMIRDAPLTGIGFNQFQHQYAAYQARFYNENEVDGETVNVIDKVDYVFNDYLQVMIENGITGFLLFMLVIGFLFYPVKENIAANRSMPAMYAGIIAILVSAAFSYSFELIFILFVFLMLAAFVSADTKPVIQVSIHNRLMRGIIVLPVLLCMIFIGITTVQEYAWRQKWRYAFALLRNENYNNATILYKEVCEGIPHEKTVLLEYGKSLLLLERYDEGLAVLENAAKYIADPFLSINLAEGYTALKKYDRAEKELLQSISMIPNRIYPRYLLAKLYMQQGDTLKASRYAEKTLQLPVKVQSQAIMQMQQELINIKKTN